MQVDRLILFGTAGVGKTTIAKEIERRGYHYHEGDDDLLPEVKELNSKNKGLTDELRDLQHQIMIENFISLANKHSRLVIAYDFMWDRYRIMLREKYDGFRWIYLTAPKVVVANRVKRANHLLQPEFALQIYDMFQPPSFVCTQVDATGSLDRIVDKILLH